MPKVDGFGAAVSGYHAVRRWLSSKEARLEALKIQLLGGFDIRLGHHSLASRLSLKQQAALTWLLLRRDAPQSRAQMAFQLWPDSSEAHALSSLRTLLLRLRRQLPELEAYLVLDRTTVQWHPELPCQLDAPEFERLASTARTPEELATALSLYSGALFPGCYEEWLEADRDRLQRLALDLLLRRRKLLEVERQYPAAIACAERSLELDPLHEETYEALMRLHTLVGQRAEAIRAYFRCAATLKKEVQASPGPVLRELYQRIVKQESLAGPDRKDPHPFVGRQREWNALMALFQRCQTAGARAAILTGAQGTGKTRLLEELLDWAARQGFQTALARGYPIEGHMALAPVASLLRCCPAEQLAPVWRRELIRLLPEWLEKDPSAGAPPPITDAWQRLHFYEALARAVLAAQPTVLAVDDLHGCDRETLEWLHFLLRFQPKPNLPTRLLLVMATSPEPQPPDAPLHGFLAALRHEDRLQSFGLEPLDQACTAELLGLITGTSPAEPGAVDQIYRETGGNPLLVTELARADLGFGGGSPGRDHLDRLLSLRRAHLSAHAQHLIEVAAVIGRECSLGLLQRASQQTWDAFLPALAELEDQTVLREVQPERVDFVQGAFRRLVVGRIPSLRLRLIHFQVARALESSEPERRRASLAEQATHLEKSGAYALAAPLYGLAGAENLKVFADQPAIEQFSRAMRLAAEDDFGTALEALLGRAQAYARTGNWEREQADLERLLALGSRVGQPLYMARAHIAASRGSYNHGQIAQAWQHAREARARAEQVGERLVAAQASVEEAISEQRLTGDRARAMDLCRSAALLAREGGDGQLELRALGLLSHFLAAAEHFEEAEATLERAVSLATCAENPLSLAQVRARQALVYSLARRPREALEYISEALRMVRELSLPSVECMMRADRGWILMLLGKLEDAALELSEALEQAKSLGLLPVQATMHRTWSMVSLAQGRVEEALREARACQGCFSEVGDEQGEAWAACLEAEARIEAGQAELALKALTPLLARLPDPTQAETGARVDPPSPLWQQLRTRVFVLTGRARTALGAYEVAQSYLEDAAACVADSVDVPPYLARFNAELALAELAVAMGRQEEARERYGRLEASLSENDRGILRPERVRQGLQRLSPVHGV